MTISDERLREIWSRRFASGESPAVLAALRDIAAEARRDAMKEAAQVAAELLEGADRGVLVGGVVAAIRARIGHDAPPSREERLRELGYSDERPEGGCADALGLRRIGQDVTE